MTEPECRCGNQAMDLVRASLPESGSVVYYCAECGRLKYVDLSDSVAGGFFGGRPATARITWREPAVLRKLEKLEAAAAVQPGKEEPEEQFTPKEPVRIEVENFKTKTVELVRKLEGGKFVQDENSP